MRGHLKQVKKCTTLLQCLYFNSHSVRRQISSSCHRVPSVSWVAGSQLWRIPRKNYCVTSNPCWNCQALGNNSAHNLFFCESCGSLLEVAKNQDYFKVLGLKSNFSITSNELTRKFRELQNIIHPDKFSNKCSLEQTNSDDWSSLINQAYKTLSIPIKRAEYILQQNGVEISEDNSALDKEFLAEMMEKNEEVAEANTKSELDKILSGIRQTLEQLFTDFDVQLNEKKFNDCKTILIRMKYFSSIENTIKTKIYQLN